MRPHDQAPDRRSRGAGHYAHRGFVFSILAQVDIKYRTDAKLAYEQALSYESVTRAPDGSSYPILTSLTSEANKALAKLAH